MSSIRLPYTASYRVGSIVFYYYRRGTYRVRLRGEPGSIPFLRAYDAAHEGYEAIAPKRVRGPAEGTLGALIVAYRSSPEWRALSDASRKDYSKGIGFLEAEFAAAPVKLIQRQHVRAYRDQAAVKDVTKVTETGESITEKVAVPSRANKVLTMLSILLAYSVELGWRPDNPAARFPKLPTGGDGYRAWTDGEVAKFRTWAVDKPFWRLAFKLALYTGQRGQDQVKMTWDQWDGTGIAVRQLKTDAVVWVPVHPDLQKELRQAPRHGDHVLMRLFNRKRGDTNRKKGDYEPWDLNAFQAHASDAIKEAGLSGVVWHGLRATAATRLAEAGCTEREIMAITGHTTPQMVEQYARHASRKTMAKSAMTKLEGSERRRTGTGGGRKNV